MKDKISKDI